ncbi:MAG: hypothetical protein K6G60_05475 [Lachnospiraceae bacterium]|nr:hypothetical protein [Lachnospiraceae bacterium]
MAERIKIAGWSPFRKSCGVTGHVLAMSEMASAYYGLRVDVRADHFGARPLESYIWELRHLVPISRKEDFYSGPDYPDYVGCLSRYEANFKTHMRYFRGDAPATPTGNFGALVRKEKPKLLRNVDFPEESSFHGGSGEVFFLDSSGKNSPYSFRMLGEADLVLVFLPGTPEAIRLFFYLYSYYLNKSFFIINKSPQDDTFLLELLSRYHVPTSRTAFIPYCPEFARACMEQTVDVLICDQVDKPKHSLYFTCIKEITKRVLVEGRAIVEARRKGEEERKKAEEEK